MIRHLAAGSVDEIGLTRWIRDNWLASTGSAGRLTMHRPDAALAARGRRRRVRR
jgi:hypothetical protein